MCIFIIIHNNMLISLYNVNTFFKLRSIIFDLELI